MLIIILLSYVFIKEFSFVIFPIKMYPKRNVDLMMEIEFIFEFAI